MLEMEMSQKVTQLDSIIKTHFKKDKHIPHLFVAFDVLIVLLLIK